MLTQELVEKIKVFVKFGFEPKGVVGAQIYGICPFSNSNKFFVNYNTLLWDSKTINLSGNLNTFLTKIQEKNIKNITNEQYEKLSKERGLPVSILKTYKFGHCKNFYTLGIPGTNEFLLDIKTFELGSKLYASPGSSLYIFNLNELNKSKNKTVFICEGEWDTIAMNYLIQLNNVKGIAVGIPGANTFKDEWIYYFKGKDIVVLYDNDEAGQDGEQKVYKKLKVCTKSLQFIHWLEKFPKGFDIRDYVKLEAIQNGRPQRCFKNLKAMLRPSPRKIVNDDIVEKNDGTEKQEPKPPIDKEMNWEKLYGIITKWLKQDNLHYFQILTGVILSNYIDGDPVWMFLVACPGEGKSEALATFKHCSEVHITSSITPNALISGYTGGKKGKEASLLPKLDRKSLIIKDFAAIQTMRDTDRDALFGILRDAYDGSAGKDFGTGETKYFKSKFSFLAGATPSIYELDYQFSALGERFLKFFMGEYLEHKDQFNVLKKAVGNVGQEDTMREEMASAMYSFIENTKEYMRTEHYKQPIITEETENKIIYLSIWCSRIKGTVSRDKFQKDEILNRAYAEVGTRTCKQLKRMLLCFPSVIYSGKESMHDYNLIKKIALDTVSARREDIFRTIFLHCQTEDDSIEMMKIVELTKYSVVAVSRVLDDLMALSVVERIGVRRPYQYKIFKNIREIADKAGLYKDDLTRNRISRSFTLTTPKKKELTI